MALQNLSNVIGINVIAGQQQQHHGDDRERVATRSSAMKVSRSRPRPTPATGMQDVYLAGPGHYVTQISAGELGGQIQVRDQQIPSVLSQLDTLAAGIENAVNTQSEGGVRPERQSGHSVCSPTPPAGRHGRGGLIWAWRFRTRRLVAASSDGTLGQQRQCECARGPRESKHRRRVKRLRTIIPAPSFRSATPSRTPPPSRPPRNRSRSSSRTRSARSQGVSLNEEAANLAQFQQAYDASARVVTDHRRVNARSYQPRSSLAGSGSEPCPYASTPIFPASCSPASTTNQAGCQRRPPGAMRRARPSTRSARVRRPPRPLSSATTAQTAQVDQFQSNVSSLQGLLQVGDYDDEHRW